MEYAMRELFEELGGNIHRCMRNFHEQFQHLFDISEEDFKKYMNGLMMGEE